MSQSYGPADEGESIGLDPAEMKLLDDALAPGTISGQRYPDWIMATIDR